MIFVYSWGAIIAMLIVGMWMGNSDSNDSMYY